MGTGATSFYRSYAEFWPFYLRQHGKRATRGVHFFGTSCALLIFAAALISGHFGWLLPALVAGYGFAWASHLWIEKNRPATFTYPLWSLRGDFHMLLLWLTGRLDRELVQHKIAP